MHSRITGLRQLAAASAIAIIAAGVAGCASTSRSSGPAALSPRQAIQLAANETRDVNSFAATVNIQLSLKPGASGSSGITAVTMSGTFQEQLHPSLLASIDFGKLSAGGQSVSGIGVILTSKALYLKYGMLSQALHSSKPWIELPLSALSQSTGVNLSSLIDQAQTSSPLTQTQLLAGATNARKVGTGTVGGVPVTEYTGTYTMSAALAKLPASVRSQFGQIMRQAGINGAKFRVWIDGQHQVRKEAVTLSGTQFTEALTLTVTSINQPVTVSVPSASQTTTIPASVLNSATGG